MLTSTSKRIKPLQPSHLVLTDVNNKPNQKHTQTLPEKLERSIRVYRIPSPLSMN